MDRSFPSCTTEHVHQQRQNGCFRDGIQRSNRVWICCCSLMKSWLMIFFDTKFALVRSDDWWVSFTRPWAVFICLGRPDEWLVWTLLHNDESWEHQFVNHLCKLLVKHVCISELALPKYKISYNSQHQMWTPHCIASFISVLLWIWSIFNCCHMLQSLELLFNYIICSNERKHIIFYLWQLFSLLFYFMADLSD